MLLAALLALVPAAHADCGATTFTFVGQPACVELAFDGTHTLLHNACEQPLLVDESVRLAASGPTIAPGDGATLRDLSVFTIGMDGRLFRTVAQVEAARCPAPPPAPAPPAEPSWFRAVIAVVMPG
jgi:hypothetical protein